MKWLLFILIPFSLKAQGYISMSAIKTERPALHVTAATGYQWKRIAGEGKMMVPLSNQAGYPAYFLANAGALFSVNRWNIIPMAGYGYRLESTEKKSLNGRVWNYSVYAVHNHLLFEAGRVDKRIYAGIGMKGFFDR